jgi:hypothetical protein
MRSLLIATLIGCGTSAAEPKHDDAPVVIELFTSQGCSSCPPADKLLDKIAKAGELAGRQVAPLAFHVDYWNDLGWTDPYSSPAWTDRQRAYARALGDDRVYTPELVVAGASGMVGSHGDRVARAIAAAPRQQAIAATASWQGDRVTVTATAPAGADVWVAVWEDGTRTAVPTGENSGTTLLADRVVRSLVKVATAGRDGTATIELRGWRAGGAVAFAQRNDRAIIGATVLRR